jgi:transposase
MCHIGRIRPAATSNERSSSSIVDRRGRMLAVLLTPFAISWRPIRAYVLVAARLVLTLFGARTQRKWVEAPGVYIQFIKQAVNRSRYLCVGTKRNKALMSRGANSAALWSCDRVTDAA